MHSFSRILLLTFSASLVTMPALAQRACNSTAPSSAPPKPPIAGGTTAPQSGMKGMASPADQAMMAGMEKMNHAMSNAPITGNTDQDFVAMMMPHHQGAIAMAEVELRYGRDPTMRRMAKDIILAQRKEITEMKRWQTRHSP